MKYVISNWKNNMTTKAVLEWLNGYSDKKPNIENSKTVIIAPSNIHIPLVKNFSDKNGFAISAQDVFENNETTCTGTVTVLQLKDFCKYCIVGHSERKETQDQVFKKRDLCLTNGITPIVCFINPKEAKEYYKKGSVLAWEDPANISSDGFYKKTLIKDIEPVVKIIKNTIPKDAPLIYGGSVNRENIKGLSSISGLDGVLVGHASLDFTHFIDIICGF